MEDGIENYTSMLIKSEKCFKREKSEKSQLYIYVPDNIVIDNIFESVIITDDKEKIADLTEKKNGKIIVFADKPAPYSGVYSKL
jgi:hypothetical protein